MITGSIVALVTPMHPDGAIDWSALARLIEYHIESGTAGLGVVGTTGESPTLTVPEHCEVSGLLSSRLGDGYRWWRARAVTRPMKRSSSPFRQLRQVLIIRCP